MSSPIILNPAEGGTITVSWAKHPGAKGEDVRFGDDDAVKAGEQNTDSNNRTRKVIAGVAGVVTSVGGTFGEVVVKLDNDPLGRSVRFAENARVAPGIVKGKQVHHFDVIAYDALWRKDSYFPNGAYRDLHTNGFDRYGNRIQFSKMVTHTQAQGHALLDPKPLAPTQRQVLTGGNARRRTLPLIDAPTSGSPLLAGSVHTVDEWAAGDLYGGKPWFRVGTLWSHSSTFTDAGTHDLPELVETAPAEASEPEPIEAVEPADTEPVEPAEEQPVEQTPPDTPATSGESTPAVTALKWWHIVATLAVIALVGALAAFGIEL